jgi:hypothetical protein
MNGTQPKRHSCYNRADFKQKIIVQKGWGDWFYNGFGEPSRCALYEEIDNPMTKDCQYTKSAKTNGDPQCAGCTRKQTIPEHA